jgi:uncharacterized membrane protein
MEGASNVSKEPIKHLLLNDENFKRLLKDVHDLFPHLNHEQVPPVVNVNDVVDRKLTIGQKVADAVATSMGSWNFIIGQAVLMIIWISLNLVAWFHHFDVYPFVLLNLAMSAQAAFTAPVIMMSQNRQAQKDRLTAENDYKTDQRSEEQLFHVIAHLEHQDALVLQIVQRLELQSQHLDKQDGAILQIVQHIEQQNQQLEHLNTTTLGIVQQIQAEHERLATQRREMMEQLHQIVPAHITQALNAAKNSSSDV